MWPALEDQQRLCNCFSIAKPIQDPTARQFKLFSIMIYCG
jgi:hypothetical protein